MTKKVDENSLINTLKKALEETVLFLDEGKKPNILVENKYDLLKEEEKKMLKVETIYKKNDFDYCLKV